MRVLIEETTQRKKALSGLLSGKAVTTLLMVALAFFIAMPAYSQNIRVKGHVSDENGQPVANVSVMVKGTTNGVSGNDNGDFEISAPSNGTLVISAVNFLPQEVRINNKQNLIISLNSIAKTESEVVVIGYGTQRREAVTGSVGSINGNTMREVPASNITQSLQGRLAGVEISQTDTKPGATMQIRIRGVRSLSANNDPLIVLDGVPFVGSIADINPNDIKSVDVLKDASATAIYGSRGANGVILITTNRGTRNQKPQITYNGRYSDITMFSKYPMMNGPEFVALRTAAGQFTNGTDEDNNTNTDWQSLFFRNGIETSHDVGLSGGSQTGSYNVDLGYYLNQGVIPTQRYTRYSLRLSLDQEVGKYIRVGFGTNSNYNINAGNQANGALYSVLSNTPIANPYNSDGSLKRTVKMPLDEQYVWTRGIMDSLKDLWLSENRGYASYNSVYGELKIPGVKGLTYRVNLGLDYVQENSGSYTAMGVGSTNPTTPSTASISNSHTFHYVVENLLTYDRTFASDHHVNVVALYSAEQNKFYSSSMSAKNIPSDQFQFYNIGQANATDITVSPNGQNYQLTGLESVMGRVMYSYKNRYFLSAAVRSDASSRLAPGHQWHTYPAVSVGWNIKDESFMQNVSFIDRLKLRVGYGETSNQAVAPYSTLGRLSTTPYNFGPTGYATGYYVSQLPNANLGWEFSKTYNFGLDFALLKNRLSGTIEYYISNTNDLLQNVSLPVTAGVTTYTANVGKTQNKGIEVSLNGTILNNVNGWSLQAGVNVYANRNKIVSLASGASQDINNGWFVGYNVDAIFDYKRIGLWTSAKDSADNHENILQPGGHVGMIKALYTGDYNNGVPTRAIGPADRQVMNVDPDFEGGFNTRLSYKEFDFDIVGVFRSGGVLISTLNGPYSYLNLESGRRNNIKIDYWTPTNTGAKYPRPGKDISGDNPIYATTLSYFNGSYLKFRAMSLGYSFLDNKWSWMKKASISNIRVYFTVQNPFVLFSDLHKEMGIDPETNSFGNQNVATGGYQSRLLTVGFNTPSTRNYVVGITMTL